MLQPADIILTRTAGALSALNLAAQTTATRSRARFTHVLVCVAPGTLVDSKPKEGVQVRNVVHEIVAGRLAASMCANGHLKVLRAQQVATETDDDAVTQRMWAAFEHAAAHLAKQYNKLFLVPKASDSASRSAVSKDAFCSELVTWVLQPLGILPASFGRASAVLPAHFQALANDAGWIDVTPAFEQWAGKLERWTHSFDPQEAVKLAQLMAVFNLSISQLKLQRGFSDAAAKLDEVLDRAGKALARTEKSRRGKARSS